MLKNNKKIREQKNAEAIKKGKKNKIFFFFLSLFCDTPDFPNRNNILP